MKENANVKGSVNVSEKENENVNAKENVNVSEKEKECTLNLFFI